MLGRKERDIFDAALIERAREWTKLSQLRLAFGPTSIVGKKLDAEEGEAEAIGYFRR
jgi:hypothetical protein